MSENIYKILENIPNVYEGWYREDIKETHVTFFKYAESPIEFSDDEFESIENSIQVDVWGTDKEETETTKEEVKNLLLKSGFNWTDSNNDFESEIGLYHLAMRFNYQEEV